MVVEMAAQWELGMVAHWVEHLDFCWVESWAVWKAVNWAFHWAEWSASMKAVCLVWMLAVYWASWKVVHSVLQLVDDWDAQ